MVRSSPLLVHMRWFLDCLRLLYFGLLYSVLEAFSGGVDWRNGLFLKTEKERKSGEKGGLFIVNIKS